MRKIRPKNPRLRLSPELYDDVRQQVFLRDCWRCQSCGTMSNLEVHHKELRSQSGDDSEQNLITLCVSCHASLHRRTNGLATAGICAVNFGVEAMGGVERRSEVRRNLLVPFRHFLITRRQPLNDRE